MSDESRADHFTQPIEDIVIVSLQPGPRTLLTNEELAEALRRVANGEDVEKVAEDVAFVKVAEDEIQ